MRGTIWRVATALLGGPDGRGVGIGSGWRVGVGRGVGVGVGSGLEVGVGVGTWVGVAVGTGVGVGATVAIGSDVGSTGAPLTWLVSEPLPVGWSEPVGTSPVEVESPAEEPGF